MGTHDEMSRDAVLSAVANAAREMVRLGYSVTDDLRTALYPPIELRRPARQQEDGAS